MPAHKRKPYYNGSITMQELLTAVCEFYGDPVDDRKQEDPDHVSLHDVADRFDITVMKARKLLITGGLYSTSLSRKVQELHAQGLTVAQITEKTGLKRASINSYLPYAHIIYNLPDISIKAERQKQYRVRKRNNDRTDAEKKKGACHREQFVNKSSFGLTGIVLRHIIRKIVFIGKAVYYDDQRPYIYQDQRT